MVREYEAVYKRIVEARRPSIAALEPPR